MRVPHRDTVRVTMSREQPQKQVTEEDKMVADEARKGWASGVGGAGKVGGDKRQDIALPLWGERRSKVAAAFQSGAKETPGCLWNRTYSPKSQSSGVQDSSGGGPASCGLN